MTLLEKPEQAVDLEFNQLNLDNLFIQHDVAVTAKGNVQ